MEFLYSVRFSRWRTGRPGFGFFAASASMADSTSAMNASSSAGSGRGIPDGGIMPERSFNATFSRGSAKLPGALRSTVSREKFPTRVSSLWQVTQ